ncbi:MAG: hypothetical protein KC416_11190 [Myxococcales bacterium]|nr:hypothetical protein [Myxococcales bacterium]
MEPIARGVLVCALAFVTACEEDAVTGTTDAAPPTSSRDGGSEDGGGACVPPGHLLMRMVGDQGRILLGWSGVGHDILQFSTDSTFAVEVFDCDDECGSCRIRGPVPLSDLSFDTPPTGAVKSQRCTNDTAKTCDADDECGEGGLCRHFLSPTSGFSVGINAKEFGFPVDFFVTGQVCTSVYFDFLDQPLQGGDRSPVQGTVDLREGSFELISGLVRAQSVAGLGAFGETLAPGTSLAFGECSSCDGDTEFYDGKRDGVCRGGPRDGLGCDVHAVFPGGKTGSYDCAPAGLEMDPNVVSIQLGPMRTSSVEWSLDGEGSPPCGLEPDKKCWCGICKDPPGVPCHVGRECNDGVCHPAPNSRPQSAECGTCTPVDKNRGVGKCDDGRSCFVGGGVIGSRIAAYGGGATEPGVLTEVTGASLSCVPGDDTLEFMPGVDAGAPPDAGGLGLDLGLGVGLTGPMAIEIRFQVLQVPAKGTDP